ncbi:MAG: DNA repair protein RecN [Mariprofundaceae bacterium]|nr:DNA repair protein RecN [Mariprofundaceae bacterium]
MLTELHVREFALIEDVHLELSPGMTVFSGETGAGKSMLVDALGAAFGSRASSDWVRHGADKAEITVVIEDAGKPAHRLLREYDMDTGDGVVLRRVIRTDGSSRAYVNGAPAPAKLLQRIGQACLDMHGQHEHQSLLRADFQRELVDAHVAGKDIAAVVSTYRQWKGERDALDKLLTERDQGVREEAWMRDELKRLQALEFHPGLVDELKDQVETGRNFARIQQAASAALAVLEDDDGNIRTRLASCTHDLEAVAEFKLEIRESLEMLGQVDALLGEAGPNLRALLDETVDPQTLEATEARLLDIHEAIRRHDTDEAGLMYLLSELETKIARMDTGVWDEESQRQRVDTARKKFLTASETLSATRIMAGKDLCKQLRPFLDRLALAGMQVRIDVCPQAEDEAAWSEHGYDTVVFMAASNPGEPFRELAAVASGGEMSRLVLALKGCGAMASAPQIAVFDEVDAGIGGETAWCVGELLAAMGHDRQVLTISHLPQVAACAAQQVHIFKEQREGRTISQLKPLNDDERQEELARMLGGANAKSREHAHEMLARGAALGIA